MPKGSHLITDFTGGEVSPRLDTRADLQRYERACREIENWIVSQQGGVMLRRGTEYVGDSLANQVTPGQRVTLIEWRGGAGDEPDILFEVVGNTVRGWTADGLIKKGGDPYQVTVPGLSFTDIGPEVQYAQRGNLLVVASKVGPPVFIKVKEPDDWDVTLLPITQFPLRRFADEVAVPTSPTQQQFTFVGFGNGDPFRIFIPNPLGAFIDFAGGGASFTTQTPPINYSTDVAQTVANIKQALDPLIGPTQYSAFHSGSGTTYNISLSGQWSGLLPTFAPVSTTGALRIEVSTTPGSSRGNEPAWSYATVVTYDPGGGIRYYRCIEPHISESGSGNVPSARTDLWVELDGPPAWEAIQPSSLWTPGNRPYGLGDRGFPTAVAFHEQRLILGGSKTAPSTIWGSAIGNPENFSQGVESDAPWAIDLDASESPYIRWLSSSNGLWAGTSAGLWLLTANITLSPTDIQAARYSSDRSDRRMARVVGNEVFFVPKGRRQLRSVRFQSETGPYETIELSALAEHLGRCGVRRVVYCQQPQPMVYLLVDTPGRVVAISYNRQGDLLAFSRIEIDGIIEDIGSIYSEKDYDVLWLAVRRGNAVTIERMPYPVTINPCAELTLASTKHLDGWVRRTAVGGEVDGLTHLLGRTVTVLNSDGTFQKTAVVVPDSTPSFGTVTFPNGTFATNLDDWNIVTGSSSWVSGEARLESSLLLGVSWLESDPIAITPGRRYRARCQYRTNVPLLGAAFPMLIRIRNSGGDILQTIFDEVIAAASMTQVEATFVAPSGAVSVEVGAYLNGSTFSIMAMTVDNYTLEVESDAVEGVVTATGSDLIIGQPYHARLKTMEPVVGNPTGPSMGNKKRWGELYVKVYESAMPLVNGDRPSDYSQPDPRAGMELLRDGRFKVNDLGWKDGSITVEQDLPHQTQVVGLYGDMSTGTGG